MELDERIIEGKKPLDCFDAKDARKQFIGKKGFFGAHESQFMDLDSCPKCVLDELKEVDNYAESPFMTSCNHCYRFFLPEEWVQPKEEKYRAYTLEEFIGAMNLGELEPWIRMRPVGSNKECKFLYTGYQETEAGEYICLGCFQFDFISLFKNYEIPDLNGKWHPFGVLDEG